MQIGCLAHQDCIRPAPPLPADGPSADGPTLKTRQLPARRGQRCWMRCAQLALRVTGPYPGAAVGGRAPFLALPEGAWHNERQYTGSELNEGQGHGMSDRAMGLLTAHFRQGCPRMAVVSASKQLRQGAAPSQTPFATVAHLLTSAVRSPPHHFTCQPPRPDERQPSQSSPSINAAA